MKKLTIETYQHDSGKLEETVSVPLAMVKAVTRLLGSRFAGNFGGEEKLEVLLEAIKNPESDGMLMEVVDHNENERVVISIV